MAPAIEIRRAAERAVTRTPWLQSRHSFSFGEHYDPGNTHHGLLLVNNDDVVAPAGGFDTHPHRDMEIVTWVLSGSLAHRDSTGNSGVIYPGLAQRMSAGTGILHSEKNESPREPVHFVQMWVVPDETGIDPGYQQLEIGDDILEHRLTTIASGMPRHRGTSAITIHNRDAALHVGRMSAGDHIVLPQAPYLHVFVARGDLTVEDDFGLHQGDAARFTASGGQRLTAGEPSEILVWEMHAELAA
jgi:quercetin 2,3-dioxygenase